MEHIFIINPSAGQGKAAKLIPAIQLALEGTTYKYSIYTTKAAGDAERFVRETCETGRKVGKDISINHMESDQDMGSDGIKKNKE